MALTKFAFYFLFCFREWNCEDERAVTEGLTGEEGGEGKDVLHPSLLRRRDDVFT